MNNLLSGVLAADGVTTAVVAGGGAVLLALFAQMFRGLRRVDEGTWAIIADRDRQIALLTRDRDHWRDLYLASLEDREADT